MIRLSPEKWDDKALYEHGFNKKSECSYCGGKMIEVPGSVYVALLGWMCEACFLGNTKPYCVTRPYVLPLRRERIS